MHRLPVLLLPWARRPPPARALSTLRHSAVELPGDGSDGSGSQPRTLVWLHGLGDSGAGFEPLWRAVQARAAPGLSVVLPNAPERAITVNMGLQMRGWYDIVSLDRPASPTAADLDDGLALEDAAGVAESTALLEELVEEVGAGDNAGVLLGGFSQGAAMALHLAVRARQRGTPFAATALFSGYALHATTAAAAAVEGLEAGADPLGPVLLVHGEEDPMVPLAWARQSYAKLGLAEQLFVEPGVPHSMGEAGLARLVAFVHEHCQ